MYYLTDMDIEENKQKIIELLSSVERYGYRKEELIRKLCDSDFFYAPASTKYHNAMEGGLADHCLNVYYNLKSLVQRKGLEDSIPEDSIIISALLHDFSKVEFYEKGIRNEKVYSATGSKSDELGRYDWVSKNCWKVRESKFVYGNHAETAEYMARQYVPLTIEESCAILNHMGGKDVHSANGDNMTEIFNQYPLAVLLHTADLISTYIDEVIDK